MKEGTKQLLRDIAYFSGLGFSVVLATVIGLAIGYWLDDVFDTSPWLTLIFLGFGIAAGFRNIYLAMKKSRNL